MENNQQPEFNPLLAAAGLHGQPWGWWAKYQLRSKAKGHKGWWIDMGSSNHLAFNDNNGNIIGASGTYIGPSSLGKDYGRFLVRGVKGIPDGIYHIDSSKIVPIQAMISDQDIAALGYDVSHLTPDADEVIDLANTRVDPITETDLLMGASKLEPLGNLAEEAAKRGEMEGGTHGDLDVDDIVYDNSTKTYGSVINVTPDNDKVSATVRWQGNRISTTTPAPKDALVRIWKAPAKERPEQEMAGGPEKGRFEGRARDLQPGDVFTNRYGEKVLVTKIKQSGRELDVYYTDPETNKITSSLYNAGDKIQISRGMGEEPGGQKPSAKPVKGTPAQPKLLTSDDARKLSVGDEIYLKKKGATGVQQFHVNSKGFIEKGVYDPESKATADKITADELADAMDAGEYESVFAGRIPTNPQAKEVKESKTEEKAPEKGGVRRTNSAGKKFKQKYATELTYGDIIVDKKDPDRELGIFLGIRVITDPKTGREGSQIGVQTSDGKVLAEFSPNGDPKSYHVIGSRPQDIAQESLDKLPKDMILKGKKYEKPKKPRGAAAQKPTIIIPEGPIVLPESIVSERTEGKPTQKQLDSVLRRIKMGIFQDNRAKEILATLPTASSTEVGKLVNEADEAEVLHLMANNLPLDGVRFPKNDGQVRDSAIAYELARKAKKDSGTGISGEKNTSGYLGSSLKYDIDEDGNIFIKVLSKKDRDYEIFKALRKGKWWNGGSKEKIQGAQFSWNDSYRDVLDEDGNPKVVKSTGEVYREMGWVRQGEERDTPEDRAEFLSRLYSGFVNKYSEVPEALQGDEDTTVAVNAEVGAKGKLGNRANYEILPSGDIALTGFMPNMSTWGNVARSAVDPSDAEVKLWILKSKQDENVLAGKATAGDSKAADDLKKYRSGIGKYRKANRNPDWDANSVVIEVNTKKTNVSPDEVRLAVVEALSSYFNNQGIKTKEDSKDKVELGPGFTYKIEENGDIVIDGNFDNDDFRKLVKEHIRKGNSQLKFNDYVTQLTITPFAPNDEERDAERNRLLNGIKDIISAQSEGEKDGEPEAVSTPETEAPAVQKQPEEAKPEGPTQQEINKAAWEEARNIFVQHNKLVKEGKLEEAAKIRAELEKKSPDYGHYLNLTDEISRVSEGGVTPKNSQLVTELGKVRGLYADYINRGTTNGDFHPLDSEGQQRFPYNNLISQPDQVVPSTSTEEPEAKDSVAKAKEIVDALPDIRIPEGFIPSEHLTKEETVDPKDGTTTIQFNQDDELKNIYKKLFGDGGVQYRLAWNKAMGDLEDLIKNETDESKIKSLTDIYVKAYVDYARMVEVYQSLNGSGTDIHQLTKSALDGGVFTLLDKRSTQINEKFNPKAKDALRKAADDMLKSMKANTPQEPVKEEEEKEKAKPVSNNGMVAKAPSTDISGAAGLTFTRTTGDAYHPTELDNKGRPKTIYTPSPGPFSGEALRNMITSLEGDFDKIRIFLGDSKVVSADSETTGFNAFDGDGQINRVVQWGFIVHNPDGTEERHSFFIRPSDGATLSEWSKTNLVRPVYGKDGKVTGTTPLTDEWLATQPTEEELLPKILEILSGNPILAAHNIQYDLPLLHDMINRINANKSEEDKVKLSFAGAIDTMDLARYITKTYDAGKGVLEGPSRVNDESKDPNDPTNRVSSAKLPDVLSFLGLKPSGWHTADGDAEDTLRILDGLLRHAAEKPDSVPKGGRFGVTAFDFAKIDERYRENLEKFLKYTSSDAPATRRQKSIDAKDGFADMLRNKYKITDEKTIEDILTPLEKATRGEAADYIKQIREQLDTKGLVDIKAVVIDEPEEKPAEEKPTQEEEKANLYKWLYGAAYNSSTFKGSKDGSQESESDDRARSNLNDIATKISNFGGLLNKLKKYQEDWETKFPKPSGKDYSDFYSGISNVVDEYSKNPDSKISKQTEAEKAAEKAAKDAEDAKALRKDLEDRAHVGDIQSVKKLTALLLDKGKKDEVRDLLAKHEDSKDTYILTQRGILAAEDGDTEKAKKLLYEALNGLSKKDRIVSPAHRALRDVLKKEKITPEPKSEPVSNTTTPKPEATEAPETEELPKGVSKKDIGELQVGDVLYDLKTGKTAKVVKISDSYNTQKKKVEKIVDGKPTYSEEDIQVKMPGYRDIITEREDGSTANWLKQKMSNAVYIKKEEAKPEAKPTEEKPAEKPAAEPAGTTEKPQSEQQETEKPQSEEKEEEKPAVEKPKVLDHIQKIDAHRDSEGVDKLVEDGYAKMVKVGDLKAGDYIFYNNQWQQILDIELGRVDWVQADDGIDRLIQQMDIQVENPIGGYAYKELADNNTPVLTPAAFEGGPTPVKPEEDRGDKKPATPPKTEKAKPKKEAKPRAQSRPIKLDLSGFTDEERALLKDYSDALLLGDMLMSEFEEGGWSPPRVEGFEGFEDSREISDEMWKQFEDASNRVNISYAERMRFADALNKLDPEKRKDLVSRAIEVLNNAYNKYPFAYDLENERRIKKGSKRWANRITKEMAKEAKKENKAKNRILTLKDLVDILNNQSKTEAVNQRKKENKEKKEKESEVVESPAYESPAISEVNGLEIEGATEITGDRKAFVEAELYGNDGTIYQTPGDLIPDVNAPEAYQKAYEKYIKDMGYEETEKSKHWFNLLVKNAKKNSRSSKRYRMLQVSGTYSHIRWIDGEVDPKALKNIVGEIKKLNDVFGTHQQKINIILAPSNTFGPNSKYIRVQPTVLSGYSALGDSSFTMVINPNMHDAPLGEDNGVKYGSKPLDGLMDATIHEYGHGIAQLLLGQYKDGKDSHGPEYNEFVSLFGHLVGNENDHPISRYAAASDGEALAEFIKAAYLAIQYDKGISSNRDISKFIDFLTSKLEDISVRGLPPVAEKNKVFASAIQEQEMANSRPNFPKKVVKKTKNNVENEFHERTPFYERGLTPYGSKLNPMDNSLVQAMYKMTLDYININSQNPTPANTHNMHVAMLNLKEAYDSFFFAYASREPRFNVETIKDNISQEISPSTYTTWSSNKPFIPGGNSDTSTKFGNQIAMGRYKADNGDTYHLAYVRTVDLTDPEDSKEKVMVIASKPNQNKDEFFGENATLRKLLESSSSTMTIGYYDTDSLEIHGVETKPEDQGQGLATALLAFARMNNKKKIVHSTNPTLSMEAWAHSVDKNPNNHIVLSRFMDRYYITGAAPKAEPAIKELEDGTVLWPRHQVPLTVQDYRLLPQMDIRPSYDGRYTADELSAVQAHYNGLNSEFVESSLISAFNKEESRLPRATYIYSGAHALKGSDLHGLFSNKNRGDVVSINDRYISATNSPVSAYETLGPGKASNEESEEGFMLIVRAPKGSRAITSSDGKILLDRGSSFRVANVNRTKRKDENGEVLENAFNTVLVLDMLSGSNTGKSLVEPEGRKRDSRSESDAYNVGREYGRNLNPKLVDARSRRGAGLGPNNSLVGYVSTNKLRSMAGNPADNEEKLKEKLDDISSKRGITHPAVVVFDPQTGFGYLWDGNHRVEAAHRNGISHVPTRVLRRSFNVEDHPNATKLGQNWADSSLSPENFPVNSHPYFVFDPADMLVGNSSVGEDLIQEMAIGLARVDMSAKDRKDVSDAYKQDASRLPSPFNPGTYVQNKANGRIGQIIGFETDGDGKYTGKLQVRYLDGIVDALDNYPKEEIDYDSNGERVRIHGISDETGSYNDRRAYTEKLHAIGDLEPVTGSFVTSGGGSIYLSDTMYGVISGEGIYGRVNRFISPGVIEIAQLTGVDKYGIKQYKMHTIKSSQFLPIQDRRETLDPDKNSPVHERNMAMDTETYAQILEVIASLRSYGYIPEDIENAIFNSIHNRFVTYTGGLEILSFLKNFDRYRRSLIQDIIRKNSNKGATKQKKYAPERPVEETTTTPAVTKNAFAVSNIDEFRSFANKDNLLNGMPLISSQHPTDPAGDSLMANIQGILYELDVVKDSEANSIISKLPNMSQKEAEKLHKKLQTALLNKRIANDQPIDGLTIPEGYNTSKLTGYAPTSKLPEDASESEMSKVLDAAMKEAIQITSGPDGAEKRDLVEYILNNPEVMAIIGKGGVGKSVLLNLLRARLTMAGIPYAVISPTGVAATPVGGVTIHSLFGFDTGPQMTNLLDVDGLGKLDRYSASGYIGAKLKDLQYLLLDEVSMVRPDLIDGMDRALRIAKGINKPFGGVALIMFGDPFQLPPVGIKELNDPELKIEDTDSPKVRERKRLELAQATEFREKYVDNWFFSADAFSKEPVPVVELTTVYRQKNGPYVDALNAVREGEVTESDLDLINGRRMVDRKNLKKGAPTIALTNAAVDLINKERSAQVEGATHKLKATIPEDLELTRDEENNLFAEKTIEVKIGDLVMLVKNDNGDQRDKAGISDNYNRWSNGTMGRLKGVHYANEEDRKKNDPDYITVSLVDSDGEDLLDSKGNAIVHKVYRDSEEKKGLDLTDVFDENSRSIKKRLKMLSQGKYEQFPIRLGYALTVHKVQGKSLDAAIIDFMDPERVNPKDKNSDYKIDPLTGEPIRREREPWDAGQLYVALSRLRSLEGLFLTRKISLDDVKVDPAVRNWIDKVRTVAELQNKAK